MFDSLCCANESGVSDMTVATGLHVVFPLLDQAFNRFTRLSAGFLAPCVKNLLQPAHMTVCSVSNVGE